MQSLQQALESVGRPVWLLLMVIGFIWFWPVGLAVFAYLAWSGRLGQSLNLKPWLPNFWGSGNAAFDEHRADTIKKLEDEQRAFTGFIADLKKAKDRSEFDQFMAKRQ